MKTIQPKESYNTTLELVSLKDFSKASKSIEHIEKVSDNICKPKSILSKNWCVILTTLISLEAAYQKCEFKQLGIIFKKQSLEVSFRHFIKQLDVFDPTNKTDSINQLKQFCELRIHLILIFKSFASQIIPVSNDPSVEFIRDTQHIQNTSQIIKNIKLEADIIYNFIKANEGVAEYNIQSSSVNLYLATNSFLLLKSKNELPLQIFIGKILETLGEKMRLLFDISRKLDEPEIHGEQFIQEYTKGKEGVQVNLMFLTENKPFNVNGYSCNKKVVESGLLNYPCIYTYPSRSSSTSTISVSHWPSIVSIVQSDQYQHHDSNQPDKLTLTNSSSSNPSWLSISYNPFIPVKSQINPFYSFFDSKMNTTYTIGKVTEKVLLISIIDHSIMSTNEYDDVEQPNYLPGFHLLLTHFKNVFHFTSVFSLLK